MAASLEMFKIGQKFEHRLPITRQILDGFRELSGDVNPIHVDSAYAQSKGFRQTISFGNVLGLGISYLIGMVLPVKEVIILKQSLDFHHPAYQDDVIRIEATVQQITAAVGAITLDMEFLNQENVRVAKGKLIFKCI